MRQTAEVIISLTQDNWHSTYDLTKATNYKISASGNTWSISSGQEISTINSIPYKRYFQVANVNRDTSGNITASGTDDPSTQKITIFLEYGNNYLSSSTLSFFLTRSENNKTLHQTDWSGGSGQTGPISNPGNEFDTSSNINHASTTGQITMTTATTTPAELVSSILDAGVSDGAGFNSLLWQGAFNTGGSVKFQIAFSNCSNGASNYPTCNTGTWTYYGCTNCDPTSCSTSNYYQPNPNVSCRFPTTGTASPQNYRYIRYKVSLSTTGTSPTVYDIIINWSP